MSEKQNGSRAVDNEYGDGRLTEILARYIDRLNSGEMLHREDILREEPELAGEILEQLQFYQTVGAGSVSDEPLGTLGDYTLRRQIGRGGMGVVYEAWQGSLDRVVALKVLPPGVAADNRAFHRFMREAKTAGQLTHQNVVAVYSTGVEEGTPWYSMEYVEGETLAQVLAKIREAEEDVETVFGNKDRAGYFEKLVRCFADVADGLQHAHSKGVTHRDIKPSNLILDGEGRLRILDFGLARIEGQESLTLTGDFVGTPLYVSPEQARRKRIPIDHRTDVYSLGATMYEALCGRPPFRGKDHQDTLSQIIERDPTSPRSVNRRVPRDLETIVLQCLRKDAGDRYGTAEALAQDLRRFVRGDPIEARPLSRWEVGMRRVWRHRSRIGLVSTVALCLVVGSTLAMVLRSRHYERALEGYDNLVRQGIDVLEMGLLAVPFDREGEVFSLGLLHPGYLGRGMALDASPAVELFRRARETLPDLPEGYVYLSRAYRAMGRIEEARAALEESLRRDPEFLPALLLKSYELGRDQAADVILSSLDRVYEHGWQREWLDAHFAAMQADWPRVEELYTRMIRSGERPFAGFEKELRLKRARVCLRQGQELRALSDFHHIRELSGGAIGPSLVLAAAYYSMDKGEDAWLLIKGAVGRGASDEDLLGAVSLLAHFGEKERVREVARLIRDSCKGFRALLRGENSIEVGKEAVAAGCDDPYVLSQYAEALRRDKRPREALELLRGALKQRPGDPTLVLQTKRTLYFVCEYDEVLKLCERYPDHPHTRQTAGFAYIRKGQLEKAKEELSAEIQYNPRAFVAYNGRSWAHLVQGNLDAALPDELRLADLNPGWENAARLRFLYGLKPGLFDPYWDELDAICAAAVRRKLWAEPRYLGFRALACLYKKDADPKLALDLAEQAVEAATDRGTHWLAETFHYLGEVRFGRGGELPEAIHALERAVSLPLTWSKSSRDLGEYRRQYFPRLASCASVDAYLRGELHDREDPLADLARVRASVADESPAVRAYLEGRLLEAEGRIDEAMRIIEPVVMADTAGEPELVLRLADWVARSGRVEPALGLIEERFASSATSAPWVLWMRIASDADLAIPELLGRLAALEPFQAKESRRRTVASDVQWLLRCLREELVARVHCGGGDYTDVLGRPWGRDRFYEGGQRYGNPRPELEIQEDRDLYYDHRRFLDGKTDRNAYRIPLPRGVYHVTLHFCATDPRPRDRKFRLAVEGETVGGILDLVKDPGLGALHIERVEVEVTDGALDLLFEPFPGCYAVVNAIEVAAVPRRSNESSRNRVEQTAKED